MALNVYKLTIVNRARWCETSDWMTSGPVELVGVLGQAGKGYESEGIVLVERYDFNMATYVVIARAASIALELAIAEAE